MAETVKVEGLQRLQSTLGRLAAALPDTAPESAARIIGQAARMYVPKRTGRLASSWASDSGEGTQTLSFGTVYAGPVHWGVGARAGLRGPHNIRASRYLLRAIDNLEPVWIETYHRELETLTSKVKGA